MAAIARDKDFRAPHPLSAILGRSLCHVVRCRPRRLAIYVRDGKRLVPIEVRTFSAREQSAWPAGASLAEVAALARHADASVTARVYAGLTEDGRARAARKLRKARFGA
jgi:hypothetical protein